MDYSTRKRRSKFCEFCELPLSLPASAEPFKPRLVWYIYVSHMGLVRNLLLKVGLADVKSERTPISVFLLDDDRRRHRWFEKRFAGDDLDIAETVEDAKGFLAKENYDAIFLDHDLLPHHYESNDHDDYATTGYAIAEFLNERSDLQRAATIIVHTRNADAAIPMVQKLRETGRNVEYVAFPMLDLKIRNYWKR